MSTTIPDPEAFKTFKARATVPVLQRLFSLLSTYEPGPIVFGLDAARYQTCDYKLLKSNGVEYFVGKISQGNYRVDAKAETHTKGAADAGQIVGGYIWADPLVSDVETADLFLETCAKLPVMFAWIDVEQEWADWTEWLAAIQGKGKITKLISPTRISQNAYNIASAIARNSSLPVVIYTRTSFILEYARPMLDWLPAFPVSLAQYPYTPGRVHITWDEFRSKLMPKSGPTLPPGILEANFQQVSGDKFYLPGCDTPSDIDFWFGTLAELQTFVGKEAPPVHDTWVWQVTDALRELGKTVRDPE